MGPGSAKGERCAKERTLTAAPPPRSDVVLSQALLAALERSRAGWHERGRTGAESLILPSSLVEGLEAMLRLLAAGRAISVGAEAIQAADRVECTECGEPLVLASAADPESWVHAPDANDLGDHTAIATDRLPPA
jgi:hypothetical protein